MKQVSCKAIFKSLGNWVICQYNLWSAVVWKDETVSCDKCGISHANSLCEIAVLVSSYVVNYHVMSVKHH